MDCNGALITSVASVGRFERATKNVVRHAVRAPFFLDELSEAGVRMRATFATKRGRCACSLGVPVGTDTAVQ